MIYTGRQAITKITANLTKQGMWDVTYEVIQRRSIDSKEWEEKSVSSNAFSASLERAQAEAFIQIMTYLEAVNGDLFSDDTEKLESGEDIKN